MFLIWKKNICKWLLGISGSLGWLEPSMNGWPNSIQFLGISAIYINKNEVSPWSWTFAAHFLSTTATQLHSYTPIPVRPPPFQAQKMGPQPKEFNRERNEEMMKRQFCRNGDIFWSKFEADFCRNQFCLVILLTSAFLSSRDQGFLSHRTTGGWVKHVWTCGGKIPWFITMFPKLACSSG